MSIISRLSSSGDATNLSNQITSTIPNKKPAKGNGKEYHGVWNKAFQVATKVEMETISIPNLILTLTPTTPNYHFNMRSQITEEGAKDFLTDDDAESSGNESIDPTPALEDEEGEAEPPVGKKRKSGGFCQPTELSQFIRNIKSKGEKGDSNDVITPNETNISITTDSCSPILEEQSKKPDSINRQICRAWLKFTFLQLGKPCKTAACPRKHEIKGPKFEYLYGDFSFKGLSSKQQATIMNKCKEDSTG